MDAKLIRENGVLKISINNEVIEPVSFRSFWPTAHTTQAFSQGGTRLMTVFPSGILCSLKVPYSQFGEIWLGEGIYDWAALRRQMDQFITNAPNAYFSLMLMLDTRDWYLKDHPKAQNSFFHPSTMAGDEELRQASLRMVMDVVDYVQREYPEKIYSIFLCEGHTCEWINRCNQNSEVTIKQDCYCAWTTSSDVAIPSDADLIHTSYGIFRDPKKDAAALRYWRFNNEILSETICWFAERVKTKYPSLLIGCFFGYLFTFPGAFLQRGHVDLNRVLNCPYVDMVFSPASYVMRGLESVSASQVPIDSVLLHEKLYFHEIDNTTFSANSNPYAQVLQTYAHRRHDSMYETIQYSRREAAFVMAKGAAHWWFDMFGGWYDDPEMMSALMDIRRANDMLTRKPMHGIAQVALLVDGESCYYISDESPIHKELVIQQRENLGHIGCPFDEYLAQDILQENFPLLQYKLYILCNTFAPSPALRQRITWLRSHGVSFLFLYAAGAITECGFSPEAVSEFTNIRVKEVDDNLGYTVIEAGIANDNGMTRIYGGRMDTLRPCLAADDPEAQELGKELISGHVQLAMKKRTQGGIDVWSASGPLPDFVLRPLSRQAGVSIYQEDGLPVYANSRMVALFDHKGGERLLHTPWESGEIVEMYTGERHVLQAGRPVVLRFDVNECKCFLHEEND